VVVLRGISLVILIAYVTSRTRRTVTTRKKRRVPLLTATSELLMKGLAKNVETARCVIPFFLTSGSEDRRLWRGAECHIAVSHWGSGLNTLEKGYPTYSTAECPAQYLNQPRRAHRPNKIHVRCRSSHPPEVPHPLRMPQAAYRRRLALDCALNMAGLLLMDRMRCTHPS